ncbi:MAG: enoyl-CoA hydratase/isomerase family protein [Chloroflexota bacterium]
MRDRTDGPLLVRHDETTAVITLNRPAQRNALNEDVLRLLRDVIAEAEHDTTVRAIVLTGAGDKAFCAGADVRHMQSMDVDRAREWSLLGHATLQAIEDLPKPVIAAINGIAVGGGCELTLACDFRFAVEAAQLGQPEIKLGMIPGWGGTQRLPRLVGPAVARNLVLTGRLVSAGAAQRLGLVDAVAADSAAVMETALTFARQFATLPPLAVGFAKHAIDRGADLSLREGILLEVEQFGRAFATEDRVEGLAAFVEKREARFNGR